jgi:hypothetical protein
VAKPGPAPEMVKVEGKLMTTTEARKYLGLSDQGLRYRMANKVPLVRDRKPVDSNKVPRSIREPPPPPRPAEQRRAECIRGILDRMQEPGYIGTVEIELLKAWDDGHGAGATT